MKRLIIVFFVSILSLGCFAQDENALLLQAKEYREQLKSLSDEDREKVLSKLESMLYLAIDSLEKEGMYMTALEMIDSFKDGWTKITDKDFPTMLYLKKGFLYSYLNDWGNAVKTTQECLSVHQNSKDTTIIFIYELQGLGFKNLKNYNDAIIAYENVLSYYINNINVGNQAATLYNIGFCYSEDGKINLAASVYEKGFNKFLDYLGTTRSALLKTNFRVKDKTKSGLFDIFKYNLMYHSLLEIQMGNAKSAYEYMKMSANCGNEDAQEFIKENF